MNATRRTNVTVIMAMVLAILMTLTLVPSPAFAATTKKVKNQAFTTTYAVANKKATAVKKGTNNLKFVGNEGYLCFKAPATKTYTFTFSNLKNKQDYSNGYVTVMTKDGAYVFSKEVKTQGGKSTSLCLSANGSSIRQGNAKTVDRYLKSRYAKMKVNKGQKVFFYTFCGFGTKGATMKLVIK